MWSDSSMRTTQVIKGEMSAKTTYQRSAKGPVSISECSADGKYVALENTGRKVRTHAADAAAAATTSLLTSTASYLTWWINPKSL